MNATPLSKPHPYLTAPTLYLWDVPPKTRWLQMRPAFEFCGLVTARVTDKRHRLSLQFESLASAEMALATLPGYSISLTNGASYIVKLTATSSTSSKHDDIPSIFPILVPCLSGLLRESDGRQRVFDKYRVFGPITRLDIDVDLGLPNGGATLQFWHTADAEAALKYANALPNGWAKIINPPSLKISGFGPSTSLDELTSLMKKFGEIKTSRFFTQPKGSKCAFITFTTDESAIAARKAVHQTIIGGMLLTVTHHQPNALQRPRTGQAPPAPTPTSAANSKLDDIAIDEQSEPETFSGPPPLLSPPSSPSPRPVSPFPPQVNSHSASMDPGSQSQRSKQTSRTGQGKGASAVGNAETVIKQVEEKRRVEEAEAERRRKMKEEEQRMAMAKRAEEAEIARRTRALEALRDARTQVAIAETTINATTAYESAVVARNAELALKAAAAFHASEEARRQREEAERLEILAMKGLMEVNELKAQSDAEVHRATQAVREANRTLLQSQLREAEVRREHGDVESEHAQTNDDSASAHARASTTGEYTDRALDQASAPPPYPDSESIRRELETTQEDELARSVHRMTPGTEDGKATALQENARKERGEAEKTERKPDTGQGSRTQGQSRPSSKTSTPGTPNRRRRAK